ncbi:MAG TPA: DUF2333 family protein [Geminicoccaceae bacterium]|nr:DUF2333 family protein [Geminicoccaceae bacterium]
MAQSTVHPAELPVARPWYRRRLWIWPLVLIGLLALYYLGGMLWLHEIDDDPDFALQSSAPDGGSQAVAVAADLIDREINTHRWVANDPLFLPGSLLDNMPEYQQGIVTAISRVSLELADQIARTRGSSQVDPDLDRASGLLRYPGTIWIFDFRTSWAPTASSEQQYRQAMVALRSYNERLTQGQAVFETRADNLLATLDRIAADIGSSSASIDRHLAESGFWPDFAADNLFYANKGRLYAYFLLLRAMQVDFADVIRERQLAGAWTQTVESFRAAAILQPWVVVNGAPDGQLLPNHLAAQGFFLLRARTQLREVSNILLK